MGLIHKLFGKSRPGFEPTSSEGELGGASYVLRGHPTEVSAVCFGLSGEVLFSADTQGNLAGFRTPSFAPHIGLSVDPQDAISAIAADLTGNVYFAHNAFVEQWKAGADFLQASPTWRSGRFSDPNASSTSAIVATAREVITGRADGHVVFWNPNSRKSHAVGKVDGAVVALSCSPTANYENEAGGMLAVGTSLGAVTVLHVDDRTIAYTIKVHAGPVRSVSFQNHRFQQRHMLATSSPSDARVCVWDRNVKLAEVPALARVVAFSPDGRFLAHGDHNDIVIRDGRNWSERERLRGHRSHVTSLSFSPMQYPDDLWDGFLASGSLDGTVRIWKVAD